MELQEREIEISDLNPRQRSIAINILEQLGVSEREDIAINVPTRYMRGEVTEFDYSEFMNSTLAINAASQFSGNNPHEFNSQYAVRYEDPNSSTLDEFTDLMAPPVMANNSRYVDYAIYSFIDAFMSLDNVADDIRAIGADYTTLRNTRKDIISQRLNERGLAMEVDEAEEYLDMTMVAGSPQWQQEKIGYLIDIGARTRLRRAVAALVAIATAASKTWDSSAGKDPDQDIMDELDNLPIRPTDIIFGTGAWSKRSRSHRAQVNAGGMISSGASKLQGGGVTAAGAINALNAVRDSAEDLAAIYGVNSVRVSRHRKATAATNIGDIIGSLVLMFYSQATPSRTDATNLKTFRAPALGPNGQVLGKRAVYVRQVGDKRWRIAVSFGSELVAVTSSIGAEVITIN